MCRRYSQKNKLLNILANWMKSLTVKWQRISKENPEVLPLLDSKMVPQQVRPKKCLIIPIWEHQGSKLTTLNSGTKNSNGIDKDQEIRATKEKIKMLRKSCRFLKITRKWSKRNLKNHGMTSWFLSREWWISKNKIKSRKGIPSRKAKRKLNSQFRRWKSSQQLPNQKKSLFVLLELARKTRSLSPNLSKSIPIAYISPIFLTTLAKKKSKVISDALATSARSNCPSSMMAKTKDIASWLLINRNKPWEHFLSLTTR